jgi:prevent-host-death family protein
MRKASLAHAKAHLADLVDDAEREGTRTVIVRHGRPAAVIAPVAVAARARPKRLRADETRRSVEAFIDEFSAAEPAISAVEDLVASRR